MIKKYKKEGIGIFVILIFSIMGVMAIGAGGVPEKLDLYPGQSLERDISLQNLPAGGGDLTFKLVVEQGSEYVSLVNEEIDVADGEISKTEIRINIPENAKVGDVYGVEIAVKTAPVSPEDSSEGTAVQFNLGTSFSFKINVIENPLEEPSEGISTIWWVLGIILIIAVILVIWFLAKNKKTSESVK